MFIFILVLALQGNAATKLRYSGKFYSQHPQMISGSDAQRIIKIRQYLPKLQ